MNWTRVNLVFSISAFSVFSAATTHARGEVEVLASGQAEPSDIVLDADHLYWTNRKSGTLMRLAKTGGPPTALIDHEDRIGRLVLDETHVYWTRQNQIMKARKDGRDSVVLATVQPTGNRGPSGILVDDDHAYWTTWDAGTVCKTAKPAAEKEHQAVIESLLNR